MSHEIKMVSAPPDFDIMPLVARTEPWEAHQAIDAEYRRICALDIHRDVTARLLDQIEEWDLSDASPERKVAYYIERLAHLIAHDIESTGGTRSDADHAFLACFLGRKETAPAELLYEACCWRTQYMQILWFAKNEHVSIAEAVDKLETYGDQKTPPSGMDTDRMWQLWRQFHTSYDRGDPSPIAISSLTPDPDAAFDPEAVDITTPALAAQALMREGMRVSCLPIFAEAMLHAQQGDQQSVHEYLARIMKHIMKRSRQRLQLGEEVIENLSIGEVDFVRQYLGIPHGTAVTADVLFTAHQRRTAYLQRVRQALDQGK